MMRCSILFVFYSFFKKKLYFFYFKKILKITYTYFLKIVVYITLFLEKMVKWC